MTATVDRWVELRGAVNVRDLGGLPTSDGGRTVAGRLLRSDNLQDLTEADVRILVEEYDVRLVLDLRTEVEIRLEGPGPLQSVPGVRHEARSLLPAAGVRTDVAAVEDATGDALPDRVLPWTAEERRSLHRGRGGPQAVSEVYGQYLRDRPDSVVAALGSIASLADGAAIVHCAAGKDRTGVVIALALSLAGVERADVVADYAASGEVIDAIVARLVASPTYAEDIASRPADSHRPLAESMQLFLAALDAEWGGAAAWAGAHGLEEAAQCRLRRRLTT